MRLMGMWLQFGRVWWIEFKTHEHAGHDKGACQQLTGEGVSQVSWVVADGAGGAVLLASD